MISERYADGGEALTVNLPAEITVRTVAEAHAQLVEAAQGGEPVTLLLDPEGEVDLAGVQLIEAARRAVDAGLTLAEPASGDLLETLRRGGFLQTGAQRAFWLKQDEER